MLVTVGYCWCVVYWFCVDLKDISRFLFLVCGSWCDVLNCLCSVGCAVCVYCCFLYIVIFVLIFEIYA